MSEPHWPHCLSQAVGVQDPDSDHHFMCSPLAYTTRGVFRAMLIKGILYPIDYGLWVSVSKSNQCLILQLDDFAKVRSNANWPSVCFNPFLMWDTIRHFIHLSGGLVFIYFILDLSQLRALTHSDRPWIPMVPATSFPHPWVSKPQLGNEAKPPGSAKNKSLYCSE